MLYLNKSVQVAHSGIHSQREEHFAEATTLLLDLIHDLYVSSGSAQCRKFEDLLENDRVNWDHEHNLESAQVRHPVVFQLAWSTEVVVNVEKGVEKCLAFVRMV